VSSPTYDTIKAQVASWLNRTDLADQIPFFIELAENRISHELRVPAMEKAVLLAVDTDGFADIPDDFLEPIEMLWESLPMERISMADLYRRTDLTGTPYAYARQRYRFKFYPMPDDLTVKPRLIYYADPGRLNTNNQTHSLLKLAPELYLYGALVEAGVFLGSEQALQAGWEQQFQAAMARLTRHARESEFSGATPTIQAGY
jgi:hypothetical protein